MTNSSPLRLQVIPVTAFQQNCTLMWREDTRAAVVVDPGGEAERIAAAAQAVGAEIGEIWLTHGHLDHAGGAAALKRLTGAPILGPHPEDQFWLEGIPAHAQMYGFAEGYEACTPDRWLGEGDRLTLGDFAFDVLHCPGHTPGHLVFHAPALKFAFVGDVLFAGSIGRTDFPRGDLGQLVASITGKLWPLGDETRFMPGHGPESTFGRERRSNPHVSDAALGAPR